MTYKDKMDAEIADSTQNLSLDLTHASVKERIERSLKLINHADAKQALISKILLESLRAHNLHLKVALTMFMIVVMAVTWSEHQVENVKTSMIVQDHAKAYLVSDLKLSEFVLATQHYHLMELATNLAERMLTKLD